MLVLHAILNFRSDCVGLIYLQLYCLMLTIRRSRVSEGGSIMPDKADPPIMHFVMRKVLSYLFRYGSLKIKVSMYLSIKVWFIINLCINVR